ncbi:MAG: prepilin peptidase [Pseudomonadota bacterium]|jgi:leader peptidase (prepilin peptidase)/N-methyltransferase
MNIRQELCEEQRLISLALRTTLPFSFAAIGQVWALWVLNIPLQFGWPFGLLAFALGVIAVADAKQKLLPLSTVAAVGLIGVALNLHATTPWWQIAAGGGLAWLGTLLVGVLGSHFAGRAALGAGDVWLAGALGLVLGLYGLAPWLLAVAVVGGAQVFWLLAHKARGQAIPFAPALLFGAWLALLYGDVYYRILLP